MNASRDLAMLALVNRGMAGGDSYSDLANKLESKANS